MAAGMNWKLLCRQAEKALAAGQRNQARRLAQVAARLAPGQERPWLLLAQTAAPSARQAYLQKALEANPRSRRAARALRSEAQPASDGAVIAWPRPVGVALLGLLALTAAFAVFAWMRPPSLDDGLRFMGAAVAHQFQGLSPSDTPQATVAFTPTFTPFATRTELPTSTPTSSPTPRYTPTPVPTIQQEVDVSIAKYDLTLPKGLGTHERWIEVNLSNQTLTAYEGRDQVNSFIISSGVSYTPTPTGEFRIWIKVPLQPMSGPGYYLKDVPWVMFFYKDYAIHGTWWHHNFGTPMSAGCVNMSIEDAKWMYDFASVGTIVQVHY